MKQINKLLLLFVCIVIGIFSYAYVIGKDLQVLDDASFDKITKISTSLEYAGNEGKDPGVLNVNMVYENDVDTFTALYEKSDLIVEGSLVQRSQDINTVCSEVDVKDVWKGDTAKKGLTIQVYEPFGYTKKDTISLFSVCLPMREKETYLLFLKEEDDGRYNLVSGLYGKYHIDQDKYLETDGQNISVSDLQQNDIMLYQMSEERMQNLEESLKLGGLDEEGAREELKSYEKLQQLRETRETIRASFDQLKKQLI